MTTTPKPPAGAPTYSPDDDQRLSHADALTVLARVRREAERSQQQAVEAEQRTAGLIPAEEVDRRLGEAHAELQRERHALLVENVGLRYQLPSELAEALKGESIEGLEQHARVLARFA